MKEITISIDKETATAIEEINDRYFFDLFKPICKDQEDEYRYRDAIMAMTKAIKEGI